MNLHNQNNKRLFCWFSFHAKLQCLLELGVSFQFHEFPCEFSTFVDQGKISYKRHN